MEANRGGQTKGSKMVNKKVCSECALENASILQRLVELVLEQLEADSPFGDTFVALGEEIAQRAELVIQYGSDLGEDK
jgi:hypothetical protein